MTSFNLVINHTVGRKWLSSWKRGDSTMELHCWCLLWNFIAGSYDQVAGEPGRGCHPHVSRYPATSQSSPNRRTGEMDLSLTDELPALSLCSGISPMDVFIYFNKQAAAIIFTKTWGWYIYIFATSPPPFYPPQVHRSKSFEELKEELNLRSLASKSLQMCYLQQWLAHI